MIVMLAAPAAPPSPAAAIPPPPTDLRVAGGGEAWQADRSFALVWTDPPVSSPPLVETRYRLRDPGGSIIDGGELSWIADGIGPIRVGDAPGIYEAEVWFADASGAQGPSASVDLRFDDTRPGPVEPARLPTWIGRPHLPLRVRLTHPAEPPPLSGIRGYAVTIDRSASRAPCAAPERCTAAETTLSGGVENDELRIAALPEGLSYLHVVAVSGAGMKSPTTGRAALQVDTTAPLTLLSGAPAAWTRQSVLLTANAADAGSGMTQVDSGPTPFTAIRVDNGMPTAAQGATVTTAVIAEGVHRVAYYARDAAGNVDDGAVVNGAVNPPARTARVRIDRTAPTLAFANSQRPDDPDLIRAQIADPLSGPDLTRGWIEVRPSGGDRFERLPPGPSAGGELRAHWHSDLEPTGRYEFRAVGFDAAGNRAVTTRRRNGEPMTLANPLKTTTRLVARFDRHGYERAVRYGRHPLLRGRLTAGIDAPQVGAPVRMVERFARGARPAQRVSFARTGPGGSFRLRTSRGPSRMIEITFDGDRTLARSTAHPLSLRVRGRVRLRTSARVAEVGGRAVVFSGRVATPDAIPAGGLNVELQFRVQGSPWSEFRSVRTDRRGRFRYAYAFSDDDSRGVKFQFRAYLPPQQNWPYEPSGSRPVLIRGV